MLQAICELGQLLIKASKNQPLKALLEYLVDTSIAGNKGNGNKIPKIYALHFKTKEDCVELEEIGEVDFQKLTEFLWVGNSPRNLPQNRLTTNTLSYLLYQTISNLLIPGKGLPPDSELARKLSEILDQFYRPAKEFGVKDKEDKLVLNLQKFKNYQDTPLPLPQSTQLGKFVEDMEKTLRKNLEERLGSKIPKGSLFTILVDEKRLTTHPDYHTFICRFYFEEPFERKLQGKCHLCGADGLITDEYIATRFPFPFYIKDKIGFASEINKDNFYKNFSLCKNCYTSLLLGEKFTELNLNSSLGGRNFLAIPSFALKLPLTQSRLENLSKYIKDRFKALETLEGYRKFRDSLNEYVDEEKIKGTYTLNLLFYYMPPHKGEFRVLKLIEDIPPSQLDKLNEVTNSVHERANSLLGESRKWYIGLKCLQELLSPFAGRAQPTHYKYLLDAYESLLAGKPIEYRPLLEQMLAVLRDKYYNPTRISDAELFPSSLIQSNLLLVILKRLNILKGGDYQAMNIDNLGLPDNIAAYMKEAGLDEKRGSLFLLGYLIGEIGNAQYQAGSSKKPILGKITFQGMDFNKLLRLANEVFDKLRQYGILDFKREGIHSVMKQLMDKNHSNWRLSDQENVYWVLSGYAFSTWEVISKKRTTEENLEKEEDSNE